MKIKRGKMPSSDTIPFRITKETKEELERIKKVISHELGISIDNISYKQAEIVFRLKASRGQASVRELQDIMLGKIK